MGMERDERIELCNASTRSCMMREACVERYDAPSNRHNCADCGFNKREAKRRKELLRENGLAYDYYADKRYLKITDDRWWNYGKQH